MRAVIPRLMRRGLVRIEQDTDVAGQNPPEALAPAKRCQKPQIMPIMQRRNQRSSQESDHV